VKRVYALIEQLDVALEQMRIGTPVTARFALILIDNVVELILHTSCEHEVLMDRSRERVLEPRYDERIRQSVIGQHFDVKAKFCRDLGMLSESAANSVLIMHSYRNELYHVGVRYDPIILALAHHYFGIATDLLPNMRVGFWQLVDTESERVRRYLPDSGPFGWQPDDLSEIGSRLRDGLTCLDKSVERILADFAIELVEDVERDLEFLTQDNFQDWNESQVLEHVQFYQYAFHDTIPPRIDRSTIRSVRELDARMEELKKSWVPRYRNSPVDRWRKRAGAIVDAANPDGALERFQHLRHEMQWLSQLVQEAARELDGAIQAEIDRRRGK
jgi:hypothetical protein